MAVGPTIEGVAYRLRPVEPADAEFILSLRNDPENSRFLPPLPGDVAAQQGWIAKQRDLPGDYYFVAENRRTGQREGLTGLYNAKSEEGRLTTEWGRFVVGQRSMAAPEISLLSHQLAFEDLGLDDVYGYSIQQNIKVVGFHRSSGLEDRGASAVTYIIDGVTYPTFCFGLARNQWPPVKARLLDSARQVERLMNRSALQRP